MAMLVGSGTSLGGLTGGAAVARLLVVVSGNTAGLDAQLAAATSSLKGFQQNASALGSTLTRTLSLPILALGGLSIKMAADFSAALARIAGLTPILDETSLSIDDIGTRLINMSQTVGVSATALAESLFFAGSAGLDANVALQVVEASAKGAAIGMGEAADISKVLIFALNNYESEGLSAAEAMDSLTVAIREGTAAPEELAIALGRLLPIAKEAGISFQTVVASVAALTNLGVPTRVATTSLRALFSQLLAPTIQATETLNTLGVTATELRAAMELGPIAAFELLAEATGGGVDALHDIIPQIRGFTAFLGLSGENLERYNELILKSQNSTGAFAKAFAQIEATPLFKFNIAVQKLSAAAIEMGNKAMPVFLGLVDILGKVGQTIENLPGPLQTALVAFLGLAAAIGPVLKVYGLLIAGGKGLFSSTTSIAAGMAVMGIAAIAAFGSLSTLAQGEGNLATAGIALVSTFVALRLAIAAMQSVALTGILGAGRLSEALVMLGGAAAPVALGLAAVGTAIFLMINNAKQLQQDMDQMAESMLGAAQSGTTLSQALKSIESEEIREDLEAIAKAAGVLQKPTAEVLPHLAEGTGEELIETLDQIVAFSGDKVDMHDEEILKFQEAIALAVNQARDLGPVFKEFGVSGAELFDILGNLGTRSLSGNSEAMSGLTDEAERLLLAYPHLIQVAKDYDTTQADAITSSLANEQALTDLAAKYGTSVPFMTEQVDKYNAGVATMGPKTEEVFAEATHIVEEGTGNIVGAQAEAAAAAAQIATDLASSLRDSFTVFGELPEKVSASMDKLITRAQQLSAIAIEEGANIRALLEAGVPASLVQKLIDEGPAMVEKFATASKSQLGKLVIAYQAGLGAVDEAILAESAHQEQKGESMVERFATSMLRRQQLPVAAAEKIVQTMTNAFAEGKVDDEGLKLVDEFANAVTEAKGISNRAAGQIIQEFANRIASGQKVGNAGSEQARKFAAGLARATPLSQREAQRIVTVITRELEAGANPAQAAANQIRLVTINALGQGVAGARAAGANTGNAFQSGLQSSLSGAVATARATANAVVAALDNALRNSPQYFTYGVGQELVNQLNEGMRSRQVAAMGRPVVGGTHRAPPARTDTMDRKQLTVNIYPNGIMNEDKLMRSASRHFMRAMRDGGWIDGAS